MLIAHATADLEPTDIGFIHGTALAAAVSGQHRSLLTLHVRGGRQGGKPPETEPWLLRWGFRAGHVTQRSFTSERYDDPAEGLIAACRLTQPDLLILPTHARSGVARLFGGSVAEAVARNLSIPCLLLPLDGWPLIDDQTGQVTLERTLVLGGSQPDAQLGVDAATWFARAVGCAAQVTLLHVFDHTPFPHTTLSAELTTQHRAGELTDVVTTVCAELQPQLIVMVSHGHDQLRDVLFANRTERVLRAARRPLLWVPHTVQLRA